MLYTYKAIVTKVYDGDTITCDIDLGLNCWMKGVKIRLAYIDTPEIRGKERESGLVSRDVVRELILGKEIILETIKDKTEKYGRYLGIVLLPNETVKKNLIGEDNKYVNLNSWLVENHYATPYKK